jgi:raffinose/stachyose/melibiose transport system permease protein
MSRREPARTRARRGVFLTVLAVFSLLYFLPLIWMVASSFKTNREIFTAPFTPPTSFDFDSWVQAWQVGNIGRYALNSAIVTSVSVSAILLFGAAAAFAFSRLRFRGSRWLLGLFAVGLLMPIQSYFIAQNSLFEYAGLKDTRWALIIPYAAIGLPLAVFLLKVFIDALPRELFEAARIDGCSDVRMFATIVIPLLRPGLATVGIFSAITAWNEFLLALLYIQDDDLKTIPAGLLAFSSRYVTDYQLLFSALSIITLPMIAIYVVFHRQVVNGLTAGAIK